MYGYYILVARRYIWLTAISVIAIHGFESKAFTYVMCSSLPFANNFFGECININILSIHDLPEGKSQMQYKVFDRQITRP